MWPEQGHGAEQGMVLWDFTFTCIAFCLKQVICTRPDVLTGYTAVNSNKPHHKADYFAIFVSIT